MVLCTDYAFYLCNGFKNLALKIILINQPFQKWNAKLALMAERYAAKCLWEHGDLEADDLPYKAVGQNLFASQNEKINFDYVTMKWFEEKSNFNFSTKTCSAGKLCGHYTQVGYRLGLHCCAISGYCAIVCHVAVPRNNNILFFYQLQCLNNKSQ